MERLYSTFIVLFALLFASCGDTATSRPPHRPYKTVTTPAKTTQPSLQSQAGVGDSAWAVIEGKFAALSIKASSATMIVADSTTIDTLIRHPISRSEGMFLQSGQCLLKASAKGAIFLTKIDVYDWVQKKEELGVNSTKLLNFAQNFDAKLGKLIIFQLKVPNLDTNGLAFWVADSTQEVTVFANPEYTIKVN